MEGIDAVSLYLSSGGCKKCFDLWVPCTQALIKMELRCSCFRGPPLALELPSHWMTLDDRSWQVRESWGCLLRLYLVTVRNP